MKQLLTNIPTKLTDALSDITAAWHKYQLAGMLGWLDIRQRYRRSALGPFWLTISMAIMITMIGVVFGQIFSAPMEEFLPFLTIGLVLWGMISAVVGESCLVFVDSGNIIRQLPLPLFLYIMRMIWRNVLIFAHNIVILPFVFWVFGREFHPAMPVAVAGFLLLIVNIGWVSLLFAVVCTRFRDFYQLIMSVLQIVFYLTPIIWMPHLIPKRSALYLLDVNPIYHLIEIVRSPLLGSYPTMLNWSVALGLAVVGWGVALVLFGHYRARIAYWL